MRLAVKHTLCQLTYSLFLILLVICFFSSCNRNREETPVIPPVTSPLSRDYIGFGVITESFTHITADPSDGSPSIGYLRRGSLVRIVRRQTIRTQDGFVTWVLTDGNVSGISVPVGWLKEEVMDIYNNESQARTASETILK
jgi:hypothetical protein